jgi:hypothetical protein
LELLKLLGRALLLVLLLLLLLLLLRYRALL